MSARVPCSKNSNRSNRSVKRSNCAAAATNIFPLAGRGLNWFESWRGWSATIYTKISVPVVHRAPIFVIVIRARVSCFHRLERKWVKVEVTYQAKLRLARATRRDGQTRFVRRLAKAFPSTKKVCSTRVCGDCFRA